MSDFLGNLTEIDQIIGDFVHKVLQQMNLRILAREIVLISIPQ